MCVVYATTQSGNYCASQEMFKRGLPGNNWPLNHRATVWNITKMANFALVKCYHACVFLASTHSIPALNNFKTPSNFRDGRQIFFRCGLATELNMHISAHSQHHWKTSVDYSHHHLI